MNADGGSRRTLIAANAAVLAMVVIHDLDHLRQAHNWGYRIPPWLLAVNSLVYLPNSLSLLSAFRGHRRAALATVASSLFIALSFLLVHLGKPFLPIWGIWNQSYFALRVDWLSWVVLASTVAVGLAAAMTGARAMLEGQTAPRALSASSDTR